MHLVQNRQCIAGTESRLYVTDYGPLTSLRKLFVRVQVLKGNFGPCQQTNSGPTRAGLQMRAYKTLRSPAPNAPERHTHF